MRGGHAKINFGPRVGLGALGSGNRMAHQRFEDVDLEDDPFEAAPVTESAAAAAAEQTAPGISVHAPQPGGALASSSSGLTALAEQSQQESLSAHGPTPSLSTGVTSTQQAAAETADPARTRLSALTSQLGSTQTETDTRRQPPSSRSSSKFSWSNFGPGPRIFGNGMTYLGGMTCCEDGSCGAPGDNLRRLASKNRSDKSSSTGTPGGATSGVVSTDENELELLPSSAGGANSDPYLLADDLAVHVVDQRVGGPNGVDEHEEDEDIDDTASTSSFSELVNIKKLQKSKDIRTLEKAMLFAFGFMLVEAVGGWLANSMAILTDAAHMLADSGGLAVSLIAVHLVQRVPPRHYTFGYAQAEIVGALISIGMVWVLVFFILMEAAERFWRLEPIDGKLMFFLAVFGLAVNLVLLKVVGHDHHACCAGCGGNDHKDNYIKSEEAQNKLQPVISKQKMFMIPGRVAKNDASSKALELEDDEKRQDPAGGAELASVSVLPAEEESSSQNAGDEVAPSAFASVLQSFSQLVSGPALGSETNLAMRAALIHILGDILQSIGIIIAAALIWLEPFDIGHVVVEYDHKHEHISNWSYADPVCSFLFAVLTMWTTKGTAKGVLNSIMLRTPRSYPVDVVREELERTKNVLAVTDIHIWRVGTTPTLTCKAYVSDAAHVRTALREMHALVRRWEIMHATIELDVFDQVARAENEMLLLEKNNRPASTSDLQLHPNGGQQVGLGEQARNDHAGLEAAAFLPRHECFFATPAAKSAGERGGSRSPSRVGSKTKLLTTTRNISKKRAGYEVVRTPPISADTPGAGLQGVVAENKNRLWQQAEKLGAPLVSATAAPAKTKLHRGTTSSEDKDSRALASDVKDARESAALAAPVAHALRQDTLTTLSSDDEFCCTEAPPM